MLSESRLSNPQKKTRLSRLYVVQLTYGVFTQKESSFSQAFDPDLKTVCLSEVEEELPMKALDRPLVKKILATLEEHHVKFDIFLTQIVREPYQWKKFDRLIQSLVLCAVAEFYMGRAPIGVIVNEYLELTRSFYSQDVVRLVHGLLQQMSQDAELMRMQVLEE